jgi:hypothetical protein
MLTKRTTDTDYEKYIDRIIKFAESTGSQIAVAVKLADLEDNSLEERNPRPAVQTVKDRARRARYAAAIRQIHSAFPGLELRPRVEDRPRARDLSGGGARTLADLQAKEHVGARGFTRRAMRPSPRKPNTKPPTPHRR